MEESLASLLNKGYCGFLGVDMMILFRRWKNIYFILVFVGLTVHEYGSYRIRYSIVNVHC